MMMRDYREILRNKRIQLGWSQYRLAKEAHVAQSFVNEIEKGKKTPSLEVFFKLCEALDIRIFPEDV